MYCGHCGKNNSDDSKVCSNCGSPLKRPVHVGAAYSGASASSNSAYNSYTVDSNMNNTAYAPPANNAVSRSAILLTTNRAWWKMFLLGIVTLGIYPMIANELMVHDLNLAASRSDGKRTFSPMLASFLGAITLFVFYFVWNHQYANRLGNELCRRGTNYKISAFHFWIFGILLSFTIVCPIIYLHKVIKATNLINEDFNRRGM